MKSNNQMIVKTIVCFLLLFSIKINAQCPTMPNNNVTICDASGFNFGDLDAFANDIGNGIVWYDSVTGTTPFTDNELVSEGTYFADDDSGS